MHQENLLNQTFYTFVLNLKGALCHFGEYIQQTLFFHDWINWKNKLILKDETLTNCFTSFIFSEPCHLSGFKLWDKQLVYSVMGKINMAEFVLLPHEYCKYQNSECKFPLQYYTVPRVCNYNSYLKNLAPFIFIWNQFRSQTWSCSNMR